MRVGIVGAGALGSVLGGLLTEKGVDTVLYERDPAEVDLITRDGLTMEGVSGDRVVRPHVRNSPEANDRDLVLVLVKTYDTVAALAAIGKALSSEGVILTLQNGIGAFDVLDEAYPGRVLLGTTTIGAMSVGKGKVRHTGNGTTSLGEIDGAVTPRAQKVADILSRMDAGPVHTTDNALGGAWSKLMVNAAINAPATLLRVRNGDLPTAAGQKLIHEIVAEGVAVAHAKDIRLLQDDPEAFVLKVCEMTAPNLNSMFQDIAAGRRTEIQYINGAIVAEGERLGTSVAVNRALTLLIRTLEATTDVRV